MGDDPNNLKSMSGSPIWRHEARDREFEYAGDSPDLEALVRHITESVAAPDIVFHEIVSDLVHVDVHWIKPDQNRRFHTLITTGMSDRPMAPPDQAREYKYAELLIELPLDWPMTEEALKDEKNYWPIGLLKYLARFPHEYNTWLWGQHSVANGEPPASYHSTTNLSAAMLAPAVNLSSNLLRLRCRPDKEVWFFAVIPLYLDEMNFKLRKGVDALMGEFERHGITELLDPGRRSVVSGG
jgi:hypothetical protein